MTFEMMMGILLGAGVLLGLAAWISDVIDMCRNAKRQEENR